MQSDGGFWIESVFFVEERNPVSDGKEFILQDIEAYISELYIGHMKKAGMLIQLVYG